MGINWDSNPLYSSLLDLSLGSSVLGSYWWFRWDGYFVLHDTWKTKSLNLLSWFRGRVRFGSALTMLCEVETTDLLPLHPGLKLLNTNSNSIASGGHIIPAPIPNRGPLEGGYGTVIFSLGPGRKQIYPCFGQLEEEWAGGRETESIRSLRASRVGCDSARAGSRSWNMGQGGGCVERTARQHRCWMQGLYSLQWP